MRPQRLSYQAAADAFTPRVAPQPRAAMGALVPAGARPAPVFGGAPALPRQRRLAAATLLALHAAAVAVLLNAGRLREVAVEAKPVFLAVVDAPARVAAPRVLPPPSATIPPPPAPTLPPIAPDAAPAPLAAPRPASPAPAATAAPVEVPSAPAPSLPRTIPPSAIQYLAPPAPVYSRISARMRESGKAVVRVFIDEAGLPRTVQLATSTGFARLDDAALAAVRDCRFKPWLDDGVAVAAWANIPIEFELPT
ncbi:MAG: TonB family protein [Burkholderiales bacterium]|nr:TonB family protein [Burkholderiales bacterium]